nr:immunoglobulin light chain junction region [Macaca mulatta]MPN87036.1 immunoglobulin light chain junction region [Macaca mulatta]MPN87542.1 immunoglobulin light chain junction region [Macaca mulatta]MPN87757.1 immunoglobulin light chain junction region [Macaca mulatta]MPN87911.1 immunoglobulin light chain junction region [Macaca mulatta]
CMQVLQTPHSC